MTRHVLLLICLACTFRSGLADVGSDLFQDPLCGVKCLYSGLVALDLDPGEYPEFVERCGEVDARGFSLGRLEEIARECGASTLAVKTSLRNLQLREERFVCIAHVDRTHFVNLGDANQNQVWVIDPPQEGLISTEVFAKRWDGNALLLSRAPLTPEVELHRPLWWGWFIAGGVAVVGVVFWGFLRSRRPS